MKKLLRHYVINTGTLYAISLIASGLEFDRGITTILLAGLALTVASIIAKPVINLLLLPINLITFNLFRWLSSTIALYLVTLVVPGFRIIGFNFGGLTSQWIALPAVSFSGALAYIAFSFVLSIITSIIYWLVS